MCLLPIKIFYNYGFKTGFHGKNLILICFSALWFVFSAFKNVGSATLLVTNHD